MSIRSYQERRDKLSSEYGGEEEVEEEDEDSEEKDSGLREIFG